MPLETLAITMQCKLRPPNNMPVVLSCNYKAHIKYEVRQPLCSWLITFLQHICTADHCTS